MTKSPADKQKKQTTLVDLCCGIGGFHLGIRQALGSTKCLLASDVDKHARSTYSRNFGHEPDGDLFDLQAKRLRALRGQVDILTAGFPCQPFSNVGQRMGGRDPRAKVYHGIHNVVQHVLPRTVVYENVPALLTARYAGMLKRILADLRRLGYRVSVGTLNTSQFGLPQNRLRAFVVAVDGSATRGFDFGVFDVQTPTPTYVSVRSVMRRGRKRDYVDPSKYTLLPPDKVKTQKSGIRFVGFLKGRLWHPEFNVQYTCAHQLQNLVYSTKGVHPTATRNHAQKWLYDGRGVFQLDMDELYAVQGFPATFERHALKTHAGQQLGNSVSPTVVRHLITEVKKQGFL